MDIVYFSSHATFPVPTAPSSSHPRREGQLRMSISVSVVPIREECINTADERAANLVRSSCGSVGSENYG
jgi:hypothetical protein